MIGVKRVYAPPAAADGCRVLVDRLWPRGLGREAAHLDQWLKEIAPSEGLRRWFGHDPARWPEFKTRYFTELAGHAQAVDELLEKARSGRLTLLYGARDEEHNNAVALKEFLEGRAGR